MDTFTALGEPTRRHILEILAGRNGTAATEIYGNFKATPPAISQHLKVLKAANLVRVEKRGQKRIYFVNPEPMKQLEKWVRRFAAIKEEQFPRLDSVLVRMRLEDSDAPMLPFEQTDE